MCSQMTFILGTIMFCGIASGQNTDEYPPLKLEVYEAGNFRIIIESTVSKINNPDEYPLFLGEVSRHYKHLKDGDLPKSKELFKYTYIFRNVEANKIKINLSAQELLDSPLLDIFQDFSLNIDSEEFQVEISFVASGTPEKIDSPLNLMFWKEGSVSQGRWLSYRAGSCQVYKPPTGIYIRKELEMMIRSSNKSK